MTAAVTPMRRGRLPPGAAVNATVNATVDSAINSAVDSAVDFLPRSATLKIVRHVGNRVHEHSGPVSDSTTTDVSRILRAAESGSAVSDELLPLVYEELRRLAAAHMAREKPGQTLQPTALVHEAYMRLIGNADMRWDSRGHFFAAAARSMRQILINRANRKKTEKHGGKLARRDLDDAFFVDEPPPERLIALDAALARLEDIDPRKGQIVMLRYFAGLSIEETAKSLDLSPASVKRDWQFARTWLHREMTKHES